MANQENLVQTITDWKTDRFQWNRLIRKDDRLSDAAKLLATALCYDFAHHETGFCNPSVDTIADAVGKSPRAVQRALAELRGLSWITIRHGHGRGNRNEILFLKGDGTVAFKPSEKVTRMADHRHEKVTPVATKGDRSVAPPCTPYKDKPNSNQKAGAQTFRVEQTERPSPHCVSVAEDGGHAHGEWDDWLGKRGLPSLREMGRKSSMAGKKPGWDVPFCRPPNPDDPIATNIAVKFARWAAFQKGIE
jgi:hypothetical protein